MFTGMNIPWKWTFFLAMVKSPKALCNKSLKRATSIDFTFKISKMFFFSYKMGLYLNLCACPVATIIFKLIWTPLSWYWYLQFRHIRMTSHDSYSRDSRFINTFVKFSEFPRYGRALRPRHTWGLAIPGLPASLFLRRRIRPSPPVVLPSAMSSSKQENIELVVVRYRKKPCLWNIWIISH